MLQEFAWTCHDARSTPDRILLGGANKLIAKLVGGFINKIQGQEEVKNLEDPLSKFNIRLVKNLLLSQNWESFQT